jgi:hypothetical protein
MVVSRLLPLLIVAAGVAVPAVLWSQLPANRPGPLLFSAVPAIVGMVVLAPQVLRPIVSQPEPFEGPLTIAFIPGLVSAWVRVKFGQLSLGLLLLSEAAALTIGRSVESVHSSAWKLPFATVAIGIGGALLLSVLSGAVLRRFG